MNKMTTLKFGKQYWHLQILLRSLALLLVTYAAYVQWLPFWTIFFASFLLYSEIYFAVHEIGHNMGGKKYPFFARYIPVATPIWGGTRVFATTHYEHHLYFGTTKDPWLKFYSGGPVESCIYNFIEPEINFLNYVRMKGVNFEIVSSVMFSLTFVFLGLYLMQEYFLYYMLAARLTHTLTIFLFNYRTHRSSMSRSSEFGFYERSQDLKRVLPLAQLVWGRGLCNGYMYHNRHHCKKQWSVHPLNYLDIKDTGSYSRICDLYEWPRNNIINLDD